MRRTFLFTAPVLLAMAGVGCATALNMQDDTLRQPYGGFTMPLVEFCGGGVGGEYSSLICWPIWLADKPLSLFADTLALPYLLWLQRENPSPPNQPSTTGDGGKTPRKEEG